MKKKKSLFIATLIFIVVGGCFLFFIWPKLNSTKAIDPKAPPQLSNINMQQLPEEITPEAVVALVTEKMSFLLINADKPYPENLTSPGPTRLIYYTTTPSYRSAQHRMRQDRANKPTSLLDVIKSNSQRLTGSPMEWQRLNLNFLKSPYPTAAQTITPKQLSEAIKDGVDMQVIDLRPLQPGDNNLSPFPNALRWMPDQVLNNLDKLSKEKWTVLVGFNNHLTQFIAPELFNKGYLLTVVLDGGYPAWVAATDR